MGFVTPKSRLKIPSKHMEFQKFTSARFSFCRRHGNRDRLFPTFTFLYFSLSHFFSSLHKQSDLALPLSMFSIFRFRVRFLFLSLSSFLVSLICRHIYFSLFLSQNLGIVQIFFFFVSLTPTPLDRKSVV